MRSIFSFILPYLNCWQGYQLGTDLVQRYLTFRAWPSSREGIFMTVMAQKSLQYIHIKSLLKSIEMNITISKNEPEKFNKLKNFRSWKWIFNNSVLQRLTSFFKNDFFFSVKWWFYNYWWIQNIAVLNSIRVLLTNMGYLDVGDESWRRNVSVTIVICWRVKWRRFRSFLSATFYILT